LAMGANITSSDSGPLAAWITLVVDGWRQPSSCRTYFFSAQLVVNDYRFADQPRF